MFRFVVAAGCVPELYGPDREIVSCEPKICLFPRSCQWETVDLVTAPDELRVFVNPPGMAATLTLTPTPYPDECTEPNPH